MTSLCLLFLCVKDEQNHKQLVWGWNVGIYVQREIAGS